jgi:thiopurine S-methyltransferase
LQPEFWHQRWRAGQVGFHQAAVDRHLERYWPGLEVPRTARVFVPLCGKSLDLLWLRDRGHSVSGVELSAIALEAFCMENGIAAGRRTLARFDLYQASRLQLYCGDFFDLTTEILGPAAAVYDRAALISWAPELRAAYVRHLIALTQPGTKILLVTVEYSQAEMTGPPFNVSAEAVQTLFEGHFAIQLLGREDTLAGEARLRARGLTALHEACYALTRLE